MELKNSKTYKNLEAAFAGESQARNKYVFSASQAKKDGYNQIGAVFAELAAQEQEHAKIWFKLLNSDIGSTKGNLKAAIAGESHESQVMYPQFAKEARDEGFEGIAKLFELVGGIEKVHTEHYKKCLERLDTDSLFSSTEEATWICDNCGYSVSATRAPECCPVCSHPQAYFRLALQ
ncbi:MAG: rubrerythrin family protein [Oscillospiraceae bacterium]|jgi:rubrerythrin|nr:rubrerythrin family protein [Oscillospiraceae bacterium]